MTKKKILHIITGLNTGGAEMMLYKLCAYRQNVDYHVISLTNIGPIGKKIQDLGVTVESLGLSKSPFSIIKFFKLIKMIKQLSPDLVQTWLYHADLIGGIAARLAGKKVFWNIRQASVNRKLNKWHTVLTSRICGLLIFIPQKVLSCTQTGIAEHAKIGYPKEKMQFVSNGFEVDQFKLGESRKKVILHIGRFAPLKDHQSFIKLARSLHSEIPEYEFHMYGDNVTVENPDLKDVTENYIKLMGRNDELYNIYPTASLLISTSLSEGFSNTIGEAMCCGTPVIATDVGDSRIIVNNPDFIVSPQNIKEMQQAVLKLLNSPPSPTSIRESITSRFDIKEVVKQYEELYLKTS